MQTCEAYLFDLGLAIKHRAKAAKEKRDAARRGPEQYHLHAGRVIAFSEAISIMQQIADYFGIPREELRLEDIDPDRDLL